LEIQLNFLKNLAGKISWVNQFSVEANGIGYSSTGNRRMRRGSSDEKRVRLCGVGNGKDRSSV
jgi:hypothetical protein